MCSGITIKLLTVPKQKGAMSHTLIVLFSWSVAIGAIIGLLRIRRVDTAWLPFIICLCIATANEGLSAWQTAGGHSTAINNNIYVLAEALLYAWQFRNWGLFRNNRIFRAIITGLTLIWVLEYHSLQDLSRIGGWFRIAASFFIVICSVTIISTLMISYTKPLITSAVFLAGIGFIIYFTYKILVEAFWKYGLMSSPAFEKNLYIVLIWVNFFVNLLYAATVVCIPAKKYYLKLS